MTPPAFTGLSIRVLGELSLTRGGAALALPPSKKTRALLAYLVLTEREHRRERLCSLFWDVTDDPRGALRWSISKLRALCDEPQAARIVTERDSVGLRLAGARVDLLEVRGRCLAGALERLSHGELEQLALEFRGELLAGLALEDFDEFQGWLVAQREQARLLHASLLRALVSRSPSPEQALPHARALVRVDALSQPARASLLELLGQLGLEAELEQQYRAGRRVLAELSIGVGAELEEAYRRARRQAVQSRGSAGARGVEHGAAEHGALRSEPTALTAEPGAAPTAAEAQAAAPPMPSAEAIPFVGREREQGVLAGLLDEAGQGRARVVLLSGEAGVGKSRLASELVQEARRRRATVLLGQAYEVEAGRPYGPWIDALRQVPRTLVGSRLAAELTMLVPEWAPAPAARPSEEQLFGAVCELLAARAHSAPPVVLLLDDVHWLDEPSCRMLHYVARFSRHRPLLVLLTAREGELFDNAASTRALRSLRRDGLLAELPIGPLAAEAITLIARHLRAGACAERIYAESAGNVLFAIELARAAASAAESLSGTLSVLIRDRVEALPAAAADVLRWAAVLGSGFPVERLELVSDLPADELALALETLQRHALLHALASARPEETAYSFVHEVVRRAVYAELSEPRRRVMHRRVVERLEPLLARDETLAADVVHHAALAGRPEVSARACLRAAERCVKLFASKDAEALVRRGFYHARRLVVAERLRLELELWRVQIDARRPEESEGVAEEIQRLGALALDHGQEDAASLAFHLLSWLRWEQNATSEALTFSLRAETLSRNLTDRERIAALGEAARCLALVDGDLGSAEALLLEAEARAGRCGVSTAALPDARGMLAWHRGELRVAAAAFAQARQQASHDADRSNEFQALEHELGVLIELEELAAARAISGQLAELSSKLRGGSEAPVARVLAALLDYVVDPARAELELDAALATLRLADVKQRLAFAQIHAAEADLKHARPASAAARATEAVRAATALSRGSDIALARSLLARAARAQGDAGAQARELEVLLATPLARLSARARTAVESALGPRPSPAPIAVTRTKGKRTHGNRGGRTPLV